MQNITITREELLNKKRDYSPLLVHLTRENPADSVEEVLETILVEHTLRACNYYCLFDDKIDSLDDATKDKFKVVCFTETPIDQIDILLERVQGKSTILEPYGLVCEIPCARERRAS